MRTYEQTHPWISFRLDLRRIPAPVWLLLGRAASLSERLGRAPLPPTAAEQHAQRILSEGVLASAAMEGNTLRPADVLAHLNGTLQLPPSQLYLRTEVDNLVKATRWTQDRLLAGDGPLTDRKSVV